MGAAGRSLASWTCTYNVPAAHTCRHSDPGPIFWKRSTRLRPADHASTRRHRRGPAAQAGMSVAQAIGHITQVPHSAYAEGQRHHMEAQGSHPVEATQDIPLRISILSYPSSKPRSLEEQHPGPLHSLTAVLRLSRRLLRCLSFNSWARVTTRSRAACCRWSLPSGIRATSCLAGVLWSLFILLTSQLSCGVSALQCRGAGPVHHVLY